MDKKNGCAVTGYNLKPIKVDNNHGNLAEESKPDTSSSCFGFAIVEDKEEFSFLLEDEERDIIELDPLDLETEDNSSTELVVFFDEEEENGLEPVPSEPPRQAPIEQISNKESIPVEKYNK